MAAGFIVYSFVFFLTLESSLFCGAALEPEHPLGLNHSSVRDAIQLRHTRRYLYPVRSRRSTVATVTTPSDVPDLCDTTYDTITVLRNELFIFIGKYCWRIGARGRYVGYPMETRKLWSILPTNFTHVDAAYERPDHKIAFFIGKQLYLFNSTELLSGYPKPLTSLGLPDSLEKLDAAMVWGFNKKTYFFSGTMYWRFDEEEGRVEMDYPRDMSMFKGVGYNIDSAFTWEDEKTYFFKGKGYWKFDNLRMRVEQDELIPSAQFWMRCPSERTGMRGTELPSSTVRDVIEVTTRAQKGNCILPVCPPHATYTTTHTYIPTAKPGYAYDIITVNLTCEEGYVSNSPQFFVCYNGQWTSQMPQCIQQCRLPSHPSVEYRCLVLLDWTDGFRACKEYEPVGTLVKQVCQTNYYSTRTLKFMHCIDGNWSNVEKCTPECGKLIPNATQLVLGGETAQFGEVPWHAGIYTKTTKPYKQICGGSLISTNTVISAAHCFWSNLVGVLPVSNFAVAVGKLYRHWDNELDNAQKSDVESIRLPVRFRGSLTNNQDDIAVVVLSTAVVYNTNIRPVCVDFDVTFERRQLQPGNKGKVAGWGLTSENGNLSQALQVVDMPYVTIDTCIDESPATFTPYITSDKICAGYNNASTALCKGDSGGGLAFPELDKGSLRYYLRGVTSSAPTTENLCNANTFISFTRLINHEYFITRFWGD